MKISAKVFRKWNNIIHRDFGYFFFGLTLIYGISGIALNHKVLDKWNAEYVVKSYDFTSQLTITEATINDAQIKQLLTSINQPAEFKKFYFKKDNTLRIFINDGIISYNSDTKTGWIEIARKRPLFNETSYLHYNPNVWWTWISDIYAGALILLAITGLFVLRGRNGITGRGAWLTLAGIILPIVFLIIFK